jgi:hypothetical protein
LGAVLACYSLILLERKRKLLFERGPFLLEQVLDGWEKLLFVFFFCGEIVLLIMTASFLLKFGLSVFLRRYAWMNKAAVFGVGVAYFSLVTMQFEVFQYFRDTLNLAIVEQLGGGSTRSAISYIQDEFAGLLDVFLAWIVLLLGGGWLIRKYTQPLSQWLRQLTVVKFLSYGKGLLTVNAVCLLAPLAVVAISPQLNDALNYSVAHQMYSVPASYLTDFDGDGFGLLHRPTDAAPFDVGRHPYATEIPGNSIDENGVGGDLAEVDPSAAVPPWNAEKLLRRNVLLLVLDSARSDLLDWRVNGEPVMPTLENVPGHQLAVFSHAGYTIPSMVAIFNGTVSERIPAVSLIERFHALRYATGVFSGQHEGFGQISRQTRLNQAGRFVDATAFPKSLRMQSNTSPSALSVPAPIVVAEFEKWLGSVGERPFFAYMNWQEMHFPYNYSGSPHPLTPSPVLRGQIVPGNRARVRDTYANAARVLDDAFAMVLNILDRAGVRENTTILVVGDHGEELFEHGYLGHGTNLSLEQNGALGKLINAAWKPPTHPVGLNDLGLVIHNALLRDPAEALPAGGEVFCYLVNIGAPQEIARAGSGGFLKYNFRNGAWRSQRRLGDKFSPAAADQALIHRWESLVIQAARARARGRRAQKAGTAE